jgi:hypothetical protein
LILPQILLDRADELIDNEVRFHPVDDLHYEPSERPVWGKPCRQMAIARVTAHMGMFEVKGRV